MRLHAGRPPALEQRQPVLLGQHQVEDDDVVVGGAGLVVGFLAVVGGVDGEAFFFQPLAQGPGEGLVVFDEQDAPRCLAPRMGFAWERTYVDDRNKGAMKS